MTTRVCSINWGGGGGAGAICERSTCANGIFVPGWQSDIFRDYPRRMPKNSEKSCSQVRGETNAKGSAATPEKANFCKGSKTSRGEKTRPLEQQSCQNKRGRQRPVIVQSTRATSRNPRF